MSNPLFDRLFGRHIGKNSTFLILEDGSRFSHGRFLKLAARYAHAFSELGLKAGDRVALQVEKSPNALAVYAACAQSGLVFLPLNTAYTAHEVDYFVSNSGAGLLIGDPDKSGNLSDVAARYGAKFLTLDANGDGSLAAKAAGKPEDFRTVDRDENDLAAILYTSGTTGRSKGAMLSQRNLLSNAEVLCSEWRFTENDVLLHALPIFHTHGLFVGTNISLLTGGAMIFLPRLDVDALIKWMPTATSMMGVPTFYTRLLGDARFTQELARNMRLFVSGSAPLLAETHRRFFDRTGHKILERYGMTETNMNTSNPYDGDRRPGTVGLPLPGVEVKVCDTDGNELPRGEIGTLEVRGANVFQGYWQMPEKTREELRENGFFITGDLAQQAEDGYVTIVGRAKDLVISGGFNIYPKEVEEALDTQDGVLESAVIGVPHPDLGEATVGIIVAKNNEKPDLDSIQLNLGNRLARFKQPRKLILIDALPRNTMGKVQKAALRDQYKGLFE